MASSTNVIPTPATAESLKPKEHGAYAILMIPIISSLAISGLRATGVAVAIASITVFFAHEPLLIALEHRGPRAKRNTPAAKRRALWLLLIGATAGATAMVLGSPTVRASLVGCLLLAVISCAVAIAGKHRTLVGQIFGVAGLSIPCLPILLAGGTSISQSLTIWTVWLLGFVSTTLAVRGVIAAQKQRSRQLNWFVLSATTVGVAIAAAAKITLPLAALPMIAGSWVLMLRPPPAKHLKRVGWTLVATTIVTAVIVIAA